MSLDAPTLQPINGAAFSVGIVAARFNNTLVDALLHQVFEHLQRAGVKEKNIHIVRVPGSNELPSASQFLLGRHALDAVVALGVLIRGDTIHYELIADATTKALQNLALSTRTSIINGVIVAENKQQAEDRCIGRISRGAEFAQAALEMAELKRKYAPAPKAKTSKKISKKK